jgi:hypothetical protein
MPNKKESQVIVFSSGEQRPADGWVGGGGGGFYSSGNGGESGSRGVVPWREDRETASAVAAALVLLREKGGRGDEGFIDATSQVPLRFVGRQWRQKKAWPIIFFTEANLAMYRPSKRCFFLLKWHEMDSSPPVLQCAVKCSV